MERLSVTVIVHGQWEACVRRRYRQRTMGPDRRPLCLRVSLNSCRSAKLNRPSHANTSGHARCCRFIGNSSDSISVRSGSVWHDFGGVVHQVTSLVPHEKYDADCNDYDIAVFKVKEPFRFSNVTQPLKLPEDSENVKTDWGLVAGWGYFIVRSARSPFERGRWSM